MEKRSILLDTSFFIRLLNPSDPLHGQTRAYFQYFQEQNWAMKCSTIAVAEYCVRGKMDELPLKTLQFLPFNLFHAERAGVLAEIGFRRRDEIGPEHRAVVPNDSKQFAQADREASIQFYGTADAKSLKMIEVLRAETTLAFDVINFRRPISETLGLLF